MEELKRERKKRQINPDRIVLDVETVARVRHIAQQIEDEFNGVIRLSNKEIVNFLIQERTDVLSAVELKIVKEKHFDEVRAAQWALKKLKSAKEAGQALTLHEVLGTLQLTASKKSERSGRQSASKSGRVVRDASSQEVASLPPPGTLKASGEGN